MLRHSDAEAFSVMLRGIASKHPVKSCVVIQEMTGPFAALRVTRARNVLAVILTSKAEESSEVLYCETRNDWTLRYAQNDENAMQEMTGLGYAPTSLARLYPCKLGCNIDALRLAKRLSHAHASTVAAFALGHTRLLRLSSLRSE